jgi:hypothetical protein
VQSGTVRDFFRSTPASPVSSIPPVLRTYFHLHVVLTRDTNGRSLGTYQKGIGERWAGKYSHFLDIRPAVVCSLLNTKTRNARGILCDSKLCSLVAQMFLS